MKYGNFLIFNQVYKRIVVDVDVYVDTDESGYDDNSSILFKIHEYISNENSEIISNLFKILELNDFIIDGYYPYSEYDESKKCGELYFNNLSIAGHDIEEGEDRESLKILKFFKGKNIIYDGSDVASDFPSHVNYSAILDLDNSGQQVESIKVQNGHRYADFVEAHHLIKVNQFENLHSITIPINSFQILSNLSKEMGYFSFYGINSDFGNSDNMKLELNQMINSFINSKSSKNLKITSVNTTEDPIDYYDYYDGGNLQTFINKINESKESFSNSFKPLFSEN
ncbi:hypothetical protein DDB_G0283433 [Dictyostelium discoideum AX4]|uniref:Uncharacterized protein n=1 Tax=Dictyostelium discoideum TaxID=44689 RepID=Q54R20_DICDI|nr:hypothetical protein DDB_G0283433 [Dictyostelium discoideum AX4]EAL65701.1 hypothetical protein DDB_G0283433 [Dictyostelium discoideum AX4]|eukprot:XP_639071.1 hypothetical protein DDB_G0283433 [Dictyostelium discoideum AX4]